jgi:hypothetical protein
VSTDRVIAVLTPYQARPGRRAIVVLDLADLQGPACGVIDLPIRLFWYPDKSFDLENSQLLREMYETVLREASRPDDLPRFLNTEVLVRIWPSLHLPKGVRSAWAERHPQLQPAT